MHIFVQTRKLSTRSMYVKYVGCDPKFFVVVCSVFTCEQ